MDYIFRWLQLRFLTGQQQALFDGLRPKYVNAPPPGTPDENDNGAHHLRVIPSGGRRSVNGVEGARYLAMDLRSGSRRRGYRPCITRPTR